MQVVFPNPAGADTSVICRPDASPSFSRWMRCGRWTHLVGTEGQCSFVASKLGITTFPVSNAALVQSYHVLPAYTSLWAAPEARKSITLSRLLHLQQVCLLQFPLYNILMQL